MGSSQNVVEFMRQGMVQVPPIARQRRVESIDPHIFQRDPVSTEGGVPAGILPGVGVNAHVTLCQKGARSVNEGTAFLAT